MFPRTALLGAALATVAAAQIATPGRFAERRLRMPPGLGPAAGPCVLADLDGDGLPDLVRASGTTLAVLLQRPDGRFELDARHPTVEFPTATLITALAVGLVDPDDIVVGLAGAPEVLLRRNPGTGRLEASSMIATTSVVDTAPSVLAIGDVDQQGGRDLVIASQSGATRVLFGDGRGGFSRPSGTPFPAGLRNALRAFAAADLDGDGDLDFVCSAPGNQTWTHVLENTDAPGIREFVIRQTELVDAAEIVIGNFGIGARNDALLLPVAGGSPPVVLDNRGRLPLQGGVPLPWANAARPVAAAAAELDGFGIDDLVLLDATGTVSVAFGLQSPQRVLGADARRGIVVGDLELDGDGDIVVVGERPPDAVLLNDGAGNFTDTERPVLAGPPIAGAQLGFLLGSQRARDPNLLVYDAAGNPHYYANDAGTRFVPHNAPAPLLANPLSASKARFSTNGDGDFVVLNGPSGVRLLSLDPSQGVNDVTSGLFAPAAQWFTAVAVGRFTAPSTVNAASELVFADAVGALHLFSRDNTGGYAEKINAFRNVASFGWVEQLLVGHFDGDGLLDLCVLHVGGVSLVLGTGNGFIPGPTLLAGTPVPDGLAADLDGDGRLDLLLETPGLPNKVTVLRNHGGGVFLDATVSAFGGPNLVPPPTDFVVVGEGERLALVFGTATGQVLVAPRGPSGSLPWFGPLTDLPLHGKGPVVDLTTGDVDGDLDDDLVVLRDGLPPHVSLNREVHLTALAVAQIGRRMDLRVDGDPNDVSLLLWGFTPLRVDLPPLGVFRLADAIVFPVSPPALGVDGSATLAVPLPAGLPAFEMQLQLAIYRNLSGLIVLGNLQRVAITLL